MNLWTIVSALVFSLGITGSQLYHLPIINFLDKGNGQEAILSEQQISDQGVVPHKIDNKSLGVKISAQSAAVMDMETGIVLWHKNSNEKRSLASITKLMTALIFLENNPGWQTEVVMKKEDETNAGTAHIPRGEKVTVKDLFNTALVASDNNSARALVRSTGIDDYKFLDLMNKKASDLGLKDTNFVDVTGLADDNKSTALDILKLAKRAFADKNIRESTSQKTYSFRSLSGQNHKVFSTNRLLDSYLDINAGKTGYIIASGYCLVSEVEGQNGERLISVVLGSESNDARFQDLKILSGWVLENFSWY